MRVSALWFGYALKCNGPYYTLNRLLLIFHSWSFFQITEVQSQVVQNTEALKGAHTEVNDLRRQMQTLEIELESQRSMVRSTQSAHAALTPTHTAMAYSALSLQVSLVDTSFTLRWPLTMELSLVSWLHCTILTHSLLSLHRKGLWRARWGTQRCVTTWRLRLSTASSWVWNPSSHSCVTASSSSRRNTRPCSTWRWSWRLRSLHTDACWMGKTSRA